ncbi:hypothetical protein [Salarchaeum japonicum]|uniref:Uncharacterized protein n=1 Tax=Salarchaeum japonicum TaxID=555573 RepID=A0AAV3T382_9EURY|nr:hypothetical protein [Salarchaeum japonicum]
MAFTSLRALLFGPTPERTRRWSLLVALVFAGSLLYFAAVNAFTGYEWPVHLALVVAQAYATGALVVSWGVAFAAVCGLVLNYGGIGVTGALPSLPRLLGLALVAGCLAALTVGTLGFAVGATLRRVSGYRFEPLSPR